MRCEGEFGLGFKGSSVFFFASSGSHSRIEWIAFTLSQEGKLEKR